MSEAAGGESDAPAGSSSSSSSSLTSAFVVVSTTVITNNTTTPSAAASPHQQQQQQQPQHTAVNNNGPWTSSTTTTITTTPPTPATAGGVVGPRSRGPPRGLMNRKMSLDLAPRELQSFSTVSVVKLSDKLDSNKQQLQQLDSNETSVRSASDSFSQQQQQQQQQSLSSASSSLTSTPPSALSLSSSGPPSNLPSPQVARSPQFRAGSSDLLSVAASSASPSSSSPSASSSSSSGNCGYHFTAALVTPQIYVGSAMDALDAGELIARGIFFILNCAVECDFSESVAREGRITKKRLDLKDNVSEDISRMFDDATSFIAEAVASGKKVLVHCFMGISRSPSIVLAYMMKTMAEQELTESIENVRSSVIAKHRIQQERDAAASPTLIGELKKSAASTTTKAEQKQDCSSSLSHVCYQQQQQEKAKATTSSSSIIPACDSSPSRPSLSPSVLSQQQKQFESSSSSSSSSVCMSTGAEQQQLQQQQPSMAVATAAFSPVSTSSSSTNSSTSSSKSYYKTTLSMIQKVRPEVLPNFAFSCALQEMDDRLLLRCTA